MQLGKQRDRVKTYRIKPQNVQAVIWTGKNVDSVFALTVTGRGMNIDENGDLYLSTFGKVKKGDYVVKSSNGDLYSLKRDDFEELYELFIECNV